MPQVDFSWERSWEVKNAREVLRLLWDMVWRGWKEGASPGEEEGRGEVRFGFESIAL